MRTPVIFAIVFQLISINVFAEDLSDRIFGHSSAANFHEQSDLTNQAVEELIVQQSAFVGNFCQICSCCTGTAINWALVNDKMIKEIEVERITVVSETEIQLVKSILEDIELAGMVTRELVSQIHSSLDTAKAEFCDECDCCDNENTFSPERAKVAKFVSIGSIPMDDSANHDINCAVTSFSPANLSRSLIDILQN